MSYIGAALISAIVSIIVTKILATRYFEIVNGHVDDMCNETKKFVEEVKSMVNKP